MPSNPPSRLDASPVDLGSLLAHDGWARGLARRLLADRAAADDLVQETWLAALGRPPDPREPARPWLFVALRNRVVSRWRAEAARRRHHAHAEAGHTSEVPSPEELLARAEAQRRLALALGELEAAYRETILLRYHEELSCADIARRQGVPAGTVRWRLKAGLDKLRERLGEADGPAGWRSALRALAGGPDGDAGADLEGRRTEEELDRTRGEASRVGRRADAARGGATAAGPGGGGLPWAAGAVGLVAVGAVIAVGGPWSQRGAGAEGAAGTHVEAEGAILAPRPAEARSTGARVPLGPGPAARLVGATSPAAGAAGAASAAQTGGATLPVKPHLEHLGSDSMVLLAHRWSEAYAALDPRFVVRVSGGGTRYGISALRNGKADLANATRRLTPREAESFADATDEEARAWLVGHDAVVVVVHPDSPIEAVSLEELVEIFAEGGTITAWSQLQGAGRRGPIVLVGAGRVSSEDAVLQGRAPRRALVTVRPAEVAARVAGTPDAIAYLPRAQLGEARVKILAVSRARNEAPIAPSPEAIRDGRYPLARELLVYAAGDPPPHARAYLDWMRSEAGQQIVKEAGHLPLPDDLGAERPPRDAAAARGGLRR
jgi:phosphate transport system substrate-binding protein